MHEQILAALAKNRYGLNRAQTLTRLKRADGGTITRSLRELEACDFISEYIPFGKSERRGYFRLVDEFSMFYKHWLQPHKKRVLVLPHNYWLQQHARPAFASFCGYNFETLCQKHIDAILHDVFNTTGLLVA